jgi:hypothetical protein
MILWKTVGYSGYLEHRWQRLCLTTGCLVGAGLASAATSQSADSTTNAARLEASEVH